MVQEALCRQRWWRLPPGDSGREALGPLRPHGHLCHVLTSEPPLSSLTFIETLVLSIRGDMLNDITLKPSGPSTESLHPGLSHSQGLVGTYALRDQLSKAVTT